MHKNTYRQKYRIFLMLTLGVLSFLFGACRFDRRQTDEHEANSRAEAEARLLDSIVIPELRFERFDLALDSLTPTNALENHRRWKTHYGIFYRDFIERILKIGMVDADDEIARVLAEIAASDDFHALGDSVALVFGETRMAKLEEEVQHAFKRLRLHLPDAPFPSRLITFYSGFAVQIPIGEDYYGVGLDMHLGAESAFYPAIVNQYPRYLSRRFTPEHLVPNLLSAHIESEVLPINQANSPTLLDQMLFEGKRLYLLDQLLPVTADTLKIGYTQKQLAWATHFEKEIWKWIVNEQLLFQSDRAIAQKFFGEAPFTAGVGEKNDSAPRLGMYIGWKMVEAYMRLHPETSWQQLIEMKDAQTFLAQAQYRGE